MSVKKTVFAVLAVFAFGALFAATASAETTLLALWLWNNEPVTELISTHNFIELLIEDTETIAGVAAFACRADVHGSVGVSGEDETTEILNADETAVGALGSEALLGTGAASGLGSECKRETACAEGTATSPIEVNPLGLPWHTLLYLKENGTFLDLTVGTGEIGYEILCLILGINAEDKCTSAENDFSIEIINDPEDAAIPNGVFTEPRAVCTQSGGKATGNYEFITLSTIEPLSGLLAVSSE